MLRVTTAVAMLAVFVAQPRPAQAQRAPTTQAVTGVAIDPTGAVLPNAEAVLTTTAGSAVQQTTTDAAGNGAAVRDAVRQEGLRTRKELSDGARNDCQ